jgi:hypothetical protein
MSGPAVLIVLGIEERPSVRIDALNEGEQARMLDWIESHPDFLELIGRAYELAESERAAKPVRPGLDRHCDPGRGGDRQLRELMSALVIAIARNRDMLADARRELVERFPEEGPA